MDGRQCKTIRFLLSTDLHLMGTWRNDGIVRNTIASGIVMTICEDSVEGMHVRRRRFNHVRHCTSFRFSRVIHVVQSRHSTSVRHSDFGGSMHAKNSIPFPVNRARDKTLPRESRGHNGASSIRTRSYRPLGGLSSNIPASRRPSMIITALAGVRRVRVRSTRTAFGIRLHPDRSSASR